MADKITHSLVSVCPVCESGAGAYSIPAGNYQIVKCSNCGLEYTTPNPSDEELKQFYGDYVDIRANSEIVALNAQRNFELLKKYGFNEGSRILDFGCGNGEFVELAGECCFGVELSSRDQDARIFEDIDSLPVEHFDFITLWGVLEHLSDPLQVVKKLTERLSPSGHLVITTVNAEGVIPYYYKPPEHLTYWTGQSIRHLLERNGLKVKVIQPYEMYQLSEIYLERLLSRTPEAYRQTIASSGAKLPKIITVPTNEFLVVAAFA